MKVQECVIAIFVNGEWSMVNNVRNMYLPFSCAMNLKLCF